MQHYDSDEDCEIKGEEKDPQLAKFLVPVRIVLIRSRPRPGIWLARACLRFCHHRPLLGQGRLRIRGGGLPCGESTTAMVCGDTARASGTVVAVLDSGCQCQLENRSKSPGRRQSHQKVQFASDLVGSSPNLKPRPWTSY